jgi:cobalt-zinc-cadmium efflux system outer membrane protein
MRPTFALLALVLVSTTGGTSFADDLARPPTAPSTTGGVTSTDSTVKSFFNRFRKAKEEVPPSPPRRRPAAPEAPATETLPDQNPGPSPRPRPLGASTGSTPGMLKAIPTAASNKPKAPVDAPVTRTQATAADLGMPIGPTTDSTAPLPGSQSLSLQQALYGALTSNPDLVALRTGNPALASAEAVEVARHFPVTLNPTVFIDYRPITLIPNGTFGNGSNAGSGSTHSGSFYHNGQGYLLVALRQPLEFGHQTTHRYAIAKAAYRQVQWQVVQAELTALVQTYRFFQTAAYRREKLRVAEQLADFNDKLLTTLEGRLKANLAKPADVALAKVEARATRQQARAARQDYLTALTDLRNQIGIPETAAETEPLGEFTIPSNIPSIDEQALVQAALSCRPDIQSAQAAIEGASAAVRLAKGDRIPSAIVGPQYVQDEAGIQYVGFNFVPTLPLANTGKPLVLQREAEQRRAVINYQQVQQRVIAQVRSAVAKWNGATSLVNDSSDLTKEMGDEIATLERLFETGQTDLTPVQQARQRLIQLENAQLDALWSATQAQADLMLALGVPNMIQSLLQTAEAGAGLAPAPPPTAPGTPPAFAPTPPTPTTNPSPFSNSPAPSPR